MGRGRTCQSFRHVRPPAAFCLQRYFNFARNWCFRGCFMPRRRWGDMWVFIIIFISRWSELFLHLKCSIWFASCLVCHRFAEKRFSYATGKHGGLAFSEAGLSTKKHYLCILAHTSKVRTPSIVSFATIIPHLITF